MRLAVNYSPQAESLLAEGVIQFDHFKCPDWPAPIALAERNRPVYVHFPLRAGDGTLTHADWAGVERLLAQTATHHVNLHLVAPTDCYPGMPLDSREPEHLEQVGERLIADVQVAARRFGSERVVVENVIYRGPQGNVVYPGVAPEVISRVVVATGCRLLLDIAHARITAANLGIDPREYIERLPVERLAELHVTGVRHDGQRLRDHMAMDEPDWALAAWALAQIGQDRWARPWAVALEYGGVGPKFEWRSRAEALAAAVPRLQELVRQTAVTHP